jgi:hypothetical protein
MKRLSALAMVFLGVAAIGGSSVACGGEDPEGSPDAGTTSRRDAGRDTGVTPEPDAGPIDSGTPDMGAKCDDPEDLGGLDSPKNIGSIDDKDADPWHKTGGIISSGRDVDAYSFVGRDATGGIIDLRAKMALPNAELCVFIRCVSGKDKTNLKSCKKGTMKTGDQGDPGCCSPSEVELDYDCTGIIQVDDSVNVLMSVTPKADMCVPYVVEYNM